MGEGGIYEPLTDSVLGLTHTWFSLILSVIFALGFIILRRAKYEISLWGALIFGLLLPVQAYLGSKLLYAIERSITLGSISEFSFNGLSLFGGIATTIAYVAIAARIMKKPMRLLFDFVAVPGVIIIIGSRVGCFFHHCCGSVCYRVADKPFYLPIQLFEVVLDLALLALIMYLDESRVDWSKLRTDISRDMTEQKAGVGAAVRKDEKSTHSAKGARKTASFNVPSASHTDHHGFLAVYVLIAYAAYRFVLEFFRDNPSFALGMTFAQYYSVGFMLLCGYLLFRKHERRLDAAYRAAHKHANEHNKSRKRRR